MKSLELLKRERNAIILAHNYVAGEVQDVADFVGDSLELAIKAKNFCNDGSAGRLRHTLVCCGVSFMAETAKILSPDSVVLHPVPAAGCPMADMVTAESLRAWRSAHPATVVVAYVNTTAATKAEVDICCTSSNAERVVRSIPADKEILFLPDRNLGENVINATRRKMVLWDGCCPIHDRITPEIALVAKAAHPGAPLLVHPECLPSVVAIADKSLSTAGMLKFVNESSAQKFIIGTEYGILHRMRKENPGKEFVTLAPAPSCPDMKLLTLESVVDALENMRHVVELPVALMDAARKPIERMINLQ